MAGDRDHVEALKAAADLEQVADRLGLQRRGKRFFCPACQADGAPHKTPDLAVSDRGFFCHRCGLKGDVLKLIEVAAGLDFPAAVAWLGRETGIPAPGFQRGRKGGHKHPVRPPIARPGASTEAASRTSSEKRAETPDPDVFDAFLNACRPIEGNVLDWLTARGIKPDVIEALRLRFCGREYQDVTEELKTRFGDAPLLTAGLLKRSKTGKPVPAFLHYYAKRVGFLVIPYLRDARPVYLKTRPPCGKDKAEALGLTRFLNTAGRIPCLYNVDALTADPLPDRVLICEGESDTWAALSAGFAAVGSPGARSFKPAWTEGFRPFVDADGRSRVYLVPDADAAGAAWSREVAGLFLKAGLPVPLEIKLPPGQDLTSYLKGGMTA